MKKYIFLLYDQPERWARTGHVAVAVCGTRDFDPKNITHYYSFYHDILPSEFDIKLKNLKKIFSPTLFFSALFELLCGLKSFTVISYEEDILMRGQSWDRYDRTEPEDIAVGTLIATLPTDPELCARYNKRGAYGHIVRLPDSLNADIFITELDVIQKTARWSPFSPLGNKVFFQPTYNCCSAPLKALQRTGLENSYHGLIPQKTPTLLRVALMCFYFFMCYQQFFSSKDDFAKWSLLQTFLFVPFIHFIRNLGGKIKRMKEFVTDLFTISKKQNDISPSELYKFMVLYLLINTLGYPFSENTVKAICVFPAAFFKISHSVNVPECTFRNLHPTQTKRTAVLT